MHTTMSPRWTKRSRARAFWVGLSAALCVAIAASCSSSNSAPCSTGDIQSCSCSGGGAGTQACTNGAFGDCKCSSEGGVADAAHETGTSGEGGTLPFMAACKDPGKPGDCDPAGCAPNCKNGPDECFNYPNRGAHCTHPCTMNSDCPEPSGGCNGMGVCKAPGTGDAGVIEGGHDAEAGGD